MGNWTDRFDPETVDEIKRYEVGEGDFLLAERLAMHKGVESVFGFHVNCLGLGKPYWEKGVYLGDVLEFALKLENSSIAWRMQPTLSV